MTLPYPYRAVKDPLALPAGFLRHQVTLQSRSTVQSATGAQQEIWNDLLTCFAGIETISEREVYQAAQFIAQVTHRITIRWPGASITVLGGMQVLFGSRVFKVQAVENVQERNRVLRLHCLEINGVQ